MESKYRVSLDIAKQLKENGFNQLCDAYWANNGCEWNIYAKGDGGNLDNHYAAPCVGRLGNDLPRGFKSEQNNIGWQCEYNNMAICNTYTCEYISEADARALMWIELKKKGLL